MMKHLVETFKSQGPTDGGLICNLKQAGLGTDKTLTIKNYKKKNVFQTKTHTGPAFNMPKYCLMVTFIR